MSKKAIELTLDEESIHKLSLISEVVGFSIDKLVDRQIKDWFGAIKTDPLSELETIGFINKLLGIVSGKEIIKDSRKGDSSNWHIISIPQKVFQEFEKICKIAKIEPDQKIINILENEIHSAEIIQKDGKEIVLNF